MLEQLSNPASGIPDVAFEQKALKFVAKRLLEPVSCHLQHSLCSNSLNLHIELVQSARYATLLFHDSSLK